MFCWKAVATLKPDLLRGVIKVVGTPPWDMATDYMQRGYLPPLALIKEMIAAPPAKYTRRHVWVTAGALRALTLMAQEEGQMYHQLKQMRLEAIRREE